MLISKAGCFTLQILILIFFEGAYASWAVSVIVIILIWYSGMLLFYQKRVFLIRVKFVSSIALKFFFTKARWFEIKKILKTTE